jgi:HEAT repeat protein
MPLIMVSGSCFWWYGNQIVISPAGRDRYRFQNSKKNYYNLEVGVMNENGSGGEWFDDLPRTGRIYQLIERSGESERRETRIRALRALGESEDPRAVRPLVKCTYDDAAEIRRYATEGLLKLRSARGADALHDRLRDKNEEWATRKLAADALGEIRSHYAIEILIECLLNRQEDLSIREYVAMVLAHTRTEKGRRALVQCCDGSDSAIANAAGAALHAFDATPSEAKQENWSMQNTPMKNTQVKGEAAFRP